MGNFRDGIAVLFGCVFAFLVSGVIYGYNALFKIMISEKAFSSLCPPDGPPNDCQPQILRLNLLFTVSISSLFGCVIVFGWLMDRVGARLTMAFAVVLFAAGTALASLGPANDAFWYVGVVTWAFTSPGFFTTSLSLSKLFPDHSAVVTTLIICLFDASSGVFFILQLLYDNLNISWQHLCWGYGVLVVVVGIPTAFMLPGKDNVESIDAKYDGSRDPSDEPDDFADADDLLLPDIDEVRSLWSYVFEPKYILAAIFMAVFSLKNAFYIGTLGQQIARIVPEGDNDEDLVNLVFNAVFPAGGLVSIPISALLLSFNRQRDYNIFGFVLLLGIAHGILNLLPYLSTQYAAIGVFAILRSLKWSAFSEFIVKHYPLRLMGSLFGISNLLFGCFTLLVYPITVATEELNAGSFFCANLVLTVLEGCMIIMPIFLLRWQCLAGRELQQL
eukprot:TRINITY_DN515_c0_g1_i4.p1 TRINITY_DN515_c0_g1~~TRINITY_DN515_c0_g1_i4.p1  ORF type:complete len:445 (-),score=128.21 TRINITY_DN515_c0_g1_i4:573-1907(-)